MMTESTMIHDAAESILVGIVLLSVLFCAILRYNDPVLTRLNRPEIYTMSPEKFDSGFYGGLLLKDNIRVMPIRKVTEGETAEDKVKDLLSGLSTEERAVLLAMLTQKEGVV